MARAVVCDVLSGEIVQIVNCPQSMISAQAAPGQVVFESNSAKNESHYYNGTTLAEYTNAQKVSKTNKLRPNDKWSNQTFSWASSITLADIKRAKEEEITEAKLAANGSYFTYAGKQIAADVDSRGDIVAINGSVSLNGVLPSNFPSVWKCLDNTYISIPDRDTWVAFYAAMVDQGTANFIKSETLKSQIAAATTEQQVLAIKW
jgi:hypothetical protein